MEDVKHKLSNGFMKSRYNSALYITHLYNPLNTHDASSSRSFNETVARSGKALGHALWDVNSSGGSGLESEQLEWRLHSGIDTR